MMFESEIGGALVLLSVLLITAGFLLIYTRKTQIVLPSAPRSNQSGFSLVELMVVVTILGVLIAISSGAWSSVRETDQVKSAAEKIRSAMAGARMRALSTGQTQYAGIDLYSEAIVSTIDASSTYDSGTDAWAPGSGWEEVQGVNLLDSKPDGSALGLPVTTIKTFSFTSRGIAMTDPALTSASILVKSATGPSTIGKILTVNAVSGRVRITDCTATCQ